MFNWNKIIHKYKEVQQLISFLFLLLLVDNEIHKTYTNKEKKILFFFYFFHDIIRIYINKEKKNEAVKLRMKYTTSRVSFFSFAYSYYFITLFKNRNNVCLIDSHRNEKKRKEIQKLFERQSLLRNELF